MVAFWTSQTKTSPEDEGVAGTGEVVKESLLVVLIRRGRSLLSVLSK